MALHRKSKSFGFRAHCRHIASIKEADGEIQKMAGKRRKALSSCPPYCDARKPSAAWQKRPVAHQKKARLSGADASRRPQ